REELMRPFTASPVAFAARGAALAVALLVVATSQAGDFVGRVESSRPDALPCLQSEGLGVLSPGQRPGWAGAITPQAEGLRHALSHPYRVRTHCDREPRAALRLPWAEDSQPFGLKTGNPFGLN